MTSIPKLQNQIIRLLSLGEIKFGEAWINYLDQGFTESDISDLIKIATDTDLYWNDETWYVPVHAWRALGQLQAKDAVIALINCFEDLNESIEAVEDLSEVLGKISKNAIAALAQYLKESSASEWPKVNALISLENIAKYNQEDKEIFNWIVEILTSYLKKPDINKTRLNALIVGTLSDLNKIDKIPDETIEVIRELYKNELVELFIAGDIEDFEIELGIREQRDTPIPKYYGIDFEDGIINFDYDPFEDDIIDFDDDDPTDFDYVFSNHNIQSISPTIRKNEPCYCGSGKKYKKCCLLTGE
jgi:hypothetical protein